MSHREHRFKWMPWIRRVHGWITIASLLALLVFGVTGITMHHGFGTDPETVSASVVVPADLLDPVDDLGIVEWLRGDHGARGLVSVFEEDDEFIMVVIERPGHHCNATIEIDGGSAEIETEASGLMGFLGEVHTGESDSVAATLLIDATGIVLVLASISGLLLWLKTANHRREAIFSLFVGSATCVGLVVWMCW